MIFHWIYKPFIYKIFFKISKSFARGTPDRRLPSIFSGKPERNKVSKRKHWKFNIAIQYKVSTLKCKYVYWSIFYSLKSKKCLIKSPKTLMLSFAEIHCGQLPLTESPGWTFDCKLMEIFTGELLNDTLVNSPPRALAVRPSLPLSIVVVLLPTTDGSAGLWT